MPKGEQFGLPKARTEPDNFRTFHIMACTVLDNDHRPITDMGVMEAIGNQLMLALMGLNKNECCDPALGSWLQRNDAGELIGHLEISLSISNAVIQTAIEKRDRAHGDHD